MKLLVSNKGFTFTEILVAMIISSMVMGGIYSTFYSQQNSYIKQDQLSMMQQNLRAAMYFMEREIRMAGFDPTGGAGAGIQPLSQSSIQITRDLNNNSNTTDTDENIIYALYDADGDLDNDLGREDVNGGTGNELLAENIDAVNFVYLDEDGISTTNPSEIRSVQITLVAKSDRRERGYQNTKDYYNQQVGDPPVFTANDNYRRKMLSVEVKCRNLGIE
jgi:type IV pilus assembly protein PilW